MTTRIHIKSVVPHGFCVLKLSDFIAAIFLMDWPENKNVVEDIKNWFLSSFVKLVQWLQSWSKKCVIKSEARAVIFVDRWTNLVRGRWVLAFCQVSSISIQWFQIFCDSVLCQRWQNRLLNLFKNTLFRSFL